MPDYPLMGLTESGGEEVIGVVSVVGEYAPGDQPPAGYNDWHEWAMVQHRAGLRQKECSTCGRLKYPQEIATTRQEAEVVFRTKRDAMSGRNPVERQVDVVVCNECAKGGGA